MLRRNAPKGTKVYYDDLGIFGEVTENVNPKNLDLIEIEFDDFIQYCHRASLLEVEYVMSEDAHE